MNPNLHHLFSSKFYINAAYGLALVPSLVQNFHNVSFVEKDKVKLHESVVSKVQSQTNTVSGDSRFVAVISFNQPVIKFSDYYSGWLGTQTYIRILEQFKNDDSVAGVVMSVDSGGGQVYGTPEFFEYVRDFTAVKPLVVYTGGYLCSGAYYFAAGASWIVAHNRADAIGSIGAYTILINFNGIWAKLGASVTTLYSSLSEDKNKYYENVMNGKDAEGKEYIKYELDPIVEVFIEDMKSVRPQIKEEAFKGGTWKGSESVEMGLVDENGTLETAIAKCWELSNTSNSNKNNPKSKKKTMSGKTKGFPAIQKVLGIEDGFTTISTISGKKGVQISEAQLEALNNALIEKETAVTTANGKVTAAEGKVTAIETAVNTAITTAKLDAAVEANATTETKITLLGAKVVEYGKKPGAETSKPKADGDQFEEEETDQDKSTNLMKTL